MGELEPYAFGELNWRLTSDPEAFNRLQFTTPLVPEPSTILLLGSGLAAAIGFGRKRLFKKA